ncbi:MAG: sulfotransferase family protein [Chromatiaceae bacterium]|nr:sulfotransferase family protein [Chromatiaceae bacterium]
MPFFEREGKVFLFIHVPKTGGTSIESHLRGFSRMFFYHGNRMIPPITRVSPQHYPISDVRGLFGSGFWQDSFAIVRNPYHRLESEYRYQKRFFWPRAGDFNEWLKTVLHVCRDDPFYLDNHLRPQVYFLDETVSLFRYECGLEAAKDQIERIMGYRSDSTLPKCLGVEKEALIWNSESLELVNHFYAVDFERLGYPRDGPAVAG